MEPAYSRRQLLGEATLTPPDLQLIKRCRHAHNRLGFAYQIGFIRLFNRLPAQQPFEIIPELLTFIALQRGIDADMIGAYAIRQPTVSLHQSRIRVYLQRHLPRQKEQRALATFLREEAFRLEQPAALLARAKTFLKERHILQPADSALLRVVGEQRRRAREEIFTKLTTALSPALFTVLDQLLDVQSDHTVSTLQLIKTNAKSPSASGMLALIAKLHAIEATKALHVDLTWLNGNYQRALFHSVKKCSVDRLKTAAPPRRYASLVCFLWQSYRDTIDQLIDMFDKLITRTQAQAQHERDHQILAQRQMIYTSLDTFTRLGKVILDSSIPDAQLRDHLYEAVPPGALETQVAALDQWGLKQGPDVFQGVMKRYSTLRQFTPHLLRAVEFVQETDGKLTPCLEALALLKQLNADHKRALPEETSLAFVPTRLLPFMHKAGKLDRRACECALLMTLRDEINAGNIAVAQSKRFGQFARFFMPTPLWETRHEAFFQRAGVPCQATEVPAYLRQRLDAAFDRFFASAPTNTYAQVDDQGWRLSVDTTSKLDAEGQQQLEQLRKWLAKHMRNIKLPDLLIQVDNALGFPRHFLPPAQQPELQPQDICAIIATIIAHGCNLGPYTMAQLTKGLPYSLLKRVSDWQMTEETQRRALAQLVKAIAKLDTSLQWGEGKTSASDGQRFALPRKVLQQTYSPKFSDFALEFYSFIADNYAPFFSMPIECTDRDAAFVLDGLCYNESDLELEEHYTDTHGFTEINFAAFAMLGRRFCPRIRGVKQQRLYRIDRERDYRNLASLVCKPHRTINPRDIVEHWDRMGQFYASLETGYTTASVALKRLASYKPSNRFYKANRDLGRLFKTEFILSYMSEPDLRSRVRRGLLKVEQLHALARDVHYGRRGRINARELHEQLNSCSCLTLILACIIYWQAKEISRVLKSCAPEADGIDRKYLTHISPIEWENVILYGQYVINPKYIR